MTNHHFTSNYDVIIAGAGPVGLFLACELALAKCSVLLLEKAQQAHSPLKQLPFGIRGLNAPSIEALYRRGLLAELEIHKRLKNPHQHAVQGAGRQAGHFAGIPFLDGNIDRSQWPYRLASSTDTSLISEIQELENILTRRAVSMGVAIKYGVALSGFEQSDNDVSIESGEQTFTGSWLVGCDGARSAVRRHGGFEFAGTEPEFTGYSTLMDIIDPEKLKPGRNLTATGMYMQSQPGYVLIQDFDGGAFHDAQKGSTQSISLEQVQTVLRRVSNTDVTISALHTAATWTDRSRQTTSYRHKRVLLAGDAAHIHSPLGGQGLNLGLGDAMNLGWKLAATIHKKAPEGLLDTYQTERHPVGVQVLDWSRAQVAIMRPDPHARALNAVMRDLLETSDGATYIAKRIWGISSRYDLGNNHPLVGCSVPNFELQDGTRLGELMHEGRGILLDFKINAALKTLASEYAEQLNYVASQAKEQLALSALLIRPDGIIAWACNSAEDTGSIKQALDLWFTR